MRPLRQAIVPALIFLCLLLGGSPQGIWRNLALQLVGLGLLLWAVLERQPSATTRAGRILLWLGAWWIALVLVQLIPLPPGWWSALPGRAPVVEGFALRGEILPWLPLSLSPAATAATLPVIAVPLGVLAGMLVLGAYRTRWCIAAVVAGTALSVLLGALQLAQGGPYLFPRANEGAAAGLFANSNHQATLLLVAIPFLAALIGKAVLGAKRRDRSSARVGQIVIAAGALAVVLLGIALNGSLAAIGLLLPVSLASLALVLPRGRWLVGIAFLLLLGGVAGLAAFSQAGSAGTSVTSRGDIYRNTLPAIADSFPVGTGLGSFERVYRLAEDPASVDSFFVNHAHSDPLEWVLETGLPGTLLLLALLAWWAARSWQLWRSDARAAVPLAATIASAAMLAHSLVDYPLRDAALQAVFALCLAFMAEPRNQAALRSRKGRSEEPAPRHLSVTEDGLVSA